MKKRVLIAVVVACLFSMVALCACGQQAESTSSSASSSSSQNKVSVITTAEGEYAQGKHHAIITVEGYDPIEVELDADAAPVSVSNFAQLANDGYYNGLRFYRIVDGFCLQGGTKGNSASGQDDSLTPIVGEFEANGIENPLADKFGRGTIAMARTGVMNSAKSTFFITLADSENVSQSLDGQYAAFGTINDAGMETVDKIVLDSLKYANGAGGAINDARNMPVIESIVITD